MLVLLASGSAACSLLVDGSDPASPDAAPSADASIACRVPLPDACEPPMCDACVNQNCGAALMRFSIGNGGDFETIAEWVNARNGALVDRRVVRTRNLAGTFVPGDAIDGAGKCSGTLVDPGNSDLAGDYLSLDGFAGTCEDGDMLTGPSGQAVFETLVANATVERGEVSAGTYAETLNILAGNTSATSFMWLTAAEGSYHGGVEGAGVVINPPNDTAGSHGLRVESDHARIDGIEITDWYRGADSSNGISVQGDAVDVVIQRVLIHDDGAPPDMAERIDGVFIGQGATATVANSAIYRVSRAAVLIFDSDTARVVNVTAYECGRAEVTANGCIDGSMSVAITAQNVISIAGPGTDPDMVSFDQVMIAPSSHNVSSDGSAPGAEGIADKAAAAVFASVADVSFDLSLVDPSALEGANLCDTDPDLSVDIRGNPRPALGPWNRGAY